MPGLNLTREEARQRSASISVESYAIDLDLAKGDTVFGTTTVVSFTAEPGTETFIDAITKDVHAVTLNGVELDPAEVSDGVRITLPALSAQNELRIVADGRYTNTGEGLHRFVDPVDGEVYLYSQFEVPDSRRMFAVFEQPDLKATFQFTVTAPAHWAVVSNSPSPKPIDAGISATGVPLKTWAFAPTPKLSSYVTALIAGPYQSVHSELTSADGRVIPLSVYARASLMQYLDAENIFTLTRAGFEFFEQQFGLAYPFAKYDQLFVPEFNAGAMENAGAVTFLENYVFRGKVTEAAIERRAITILHELAHMWFGDLVTMRWWNDLWLNESFAEFMSTLAAAENTEFIQAWTTFSSLEKSWAYRQDQLPSTHPIVAEIRDLEDVQVNFDGITYAKGASVLRQLVAWVGQEEFMSGVRAYFQEHAWGNTELPDLLRKLEAASGRDLSEWSELWLETAGVNTLSSRIDTDEHGVITGFAITQTAPADYPTLRPHRMAIGFYDLVTAPRTEEPALVRTHRVELDVRGELTEVPELIGRERPALILPNDDDLAYAKVRLDPLSLKTASAHLKDFRDSLPRTLVLASVWDATRDGEIPARDFIELILANIGSETDSSVMLVLLRQLSTALASYTAADARQKAQISAAGRLWALTNEAGSGSDAQLQFLRSFALLAQSPEHLDVVTALLSGERTAPGLDVDQDLRWELLASLAADGRVTQKEIDAELRQDDTQTGQLAATLAAAAIPTSENKARVWRELVTEGSLSNAAQRSALSGFSRVHDSDLLRPFRERYFTAIRQIWSERSHEIASGLVEGLYPVWLVEPETLELTDAFLKDLGDAPPALARLVLEGQDTVARALKAQATDATARSGGTDASGASLSDRH